MVPELHRVTSDALSRLEVTSYLNEMVKRYPKYDLMWHHQIIKKKIKYQKPFYLQVNAELVSLMCAAWNMHADWCDWSLNTGIRKNLQCIPFDLYRPSTVDHRHVESFCNEKTENDRHEYLFSEASDAKIAIPSTLGMAFQLRTTIRSLKMNKEKSFRHPHS